MRYFTVSERLTQTPVQSNEQELNPWWAPAMPLLDELRTPLWWTPDGATFTGCPTTTEEVSR